jgi:predicted ferric reductase
MGIGIAVTRGSAAALSFCYAILLLTMSRNMLTKLKETSIYQYIPIDSHVQFHKICACTALFFTLVHVAGHLVNFYHIATQPLERLACLSPEMTFDSDFKPDFPYFLFKTLAGITGVLLYTICCIIFIFSASNVRQKAYNYFWMAHQFYILLFVLMLFHGLQRLTAEPNFWLFMIGPATVFVIDKIVSLRRGYMELDVLETELLPSDVIKITFYRPPNFTFRSGQWVRVKCEAIGNSEWHSLSITSAPHENSLSLHIKAKGPWTWRLRNHFDSNFVSVKTGVAQLVGAMKDPSGQQPEYWEVKSKKDNSKKRKLANVNSKDKIYSQRGVTDKKSNEIKQTQKSSTTSSKDLTPDNEHIMKQQVLHDRLDREAKAREAKAHAKIKLEGPFGGGNQDWYKFEIAVMIGAGIGITPYASILNDLVYGTSTNKFSGVACRKVYFLWICPSHRNYEWFIEVLREVEEKDITNVLDIHIFITQFFHKYDLRTTMLYICENHFQRLSQKSLFTGLKAANHFGRPDLVSFLRYVQKSHSYVSKIGVFSCGPRSVTRASEAACESVNQCRNLPYTSHHFEQYS